VKPTKDGSGIEIEITGLESWLLPDGAPHLHEYSNLLRIGMSEPEARKIVEDKLIKSGLAKPEDFGRTLTTTAGAIKDE
jgi:hypothetical protein